MADNVQQRARLVGTNHVALEVGDIDEALAFYESLFEFELRGRSESSAFIDMGDQFIALAKTEDAGEASDGHRHVGLVVDERSSVEQSLEREGVDTLDVPGLEFHDPWGNRIQLVEYADVQFTKAEHVLKGMGLGDLEKSQAAIKELTTKGLAPENNEHSDE